MRAVGVESARASAGTRANGSGAHDREAVRGEPAAQVVEERPHAHDVGVQHEPGDGIAVGPGVDRVDRPSPSTARA